MTDASDVDGCQEMIQYQTESHNDDKSKLTSFFGWESKEEISGQLLKH